MSEGGSQTGSPPTLTGPTRFYLPYKTTNDAGISPAYTTGWDFTSSAIRNAMPKSRGSTAITNVVLTKSVTTNNYDMLFRQYVSAPLAWGVTVSGTIKGAIRGLTSANANNAFITQVVKLVDSSGGNERVLYSLSTSTATNNAWEFTTAAGVRSIPSGNFGTTFTLTSQTANTGDRLVVEIGQRLNTTSSGVTSTLAFGDNQASDIPESTTTSTLNPWVEFSIGLPVDHAYRQIFVEPAISVAASGLKSEDYDDPAFSKGFSFGFVRFLESFSQGFSSGFARLVSGNINSAPALSINQQISAQIIPEARVQATLSGAQSVTVSGVHESRRAVTLDHALQVSVQIRPGVISSASTAHTHTVSATALGLEEASGSAVILVGDAPIAVVAQGNAETHAEAEILHTIATSAEIASGSLASATIVCLHSVGATGQPDKQVDAALEAASSVTAFLESTSRVVAQISHNTSTSAVVTLEEEVSGFAVFDHVQNAAADVLTGRQSTWSVGHSYEITADIVPESRTTASTSHITQITLLAAESSRQVQASVNLATSVLATRLGSEEVSATATIAVGSTGGFSSGFSVGFSTQGKPIAVSAQGYAEALIEVSVPHAVGVSADILPESLVDAVLAATIAAAALSEPIANVTAQISHDVEIAAVSGTEEQASGAAVIGHAVSLSAEILPETQDQASLTYTVSTSAAVRSEARVDVDLDLTASLDAVSSSAREAQAVLSATQAVSASAVIGETTTATARTDHTHTTTASVEKAARVSAISALDHSTSAAVDVSSLVVAGAIAHNTSVVASGSAGESAAEAVVVSHTVAIAGAIRKETRQSAILPLSSSGPHVASRPDKLAAGVVSASAQTSAVAVAASAGSVSLTFGHSHQANAAGKKSVLASALVGHISGVVIGAETAVIGTAPVSLSVATSAFGQRGFSATAFASINLNIAALVSKGARSSVETGSAIYPATSDGFKTSRPTVSIANSAQAFVDIVTDKTASAAVPALSYTIGQWQTERFGEATIANVATGSAQGLTVPPDLLLARISLVGSTTPVINLIGQVYPTTHLVGIANEAD